MPKFGQRKEVLFRTTKSMERWLIGRASGIVVLTHRAASLLHDWYPREIGREAPGGHPVLCRPPGTPCSRVDPPGRPRRYSEATKFGLRGKIGRQIPNTGVGRPVRGSAGSRPGLSIDRAHSKRLRRAVAPMRCNAVWNQ